MGGSPRVPYDLSQKVTVTGTVAQYIWANSHVYFIFDVKGRTRSSGEL